MNTINNTTAPVVALGFNNLPAHVKAAGYDPKNVKHGIVHVGPGGFFMAHFAHFVHDYMAKSNDLNWGITVASLRSPGTITGLRKQDNLYVLVEREEDTRKAAVLAPIVGSIFALNVLLAILAATTILHNGIAVQTVCAFIGVAAVAAELMWLGRAPAKS